MEHRHGERLPINIPATVHTTRGQQIAVRISNLSCGGAFLSVGTTRISLLGLIDVEFSAPYGDFRRYRWRAFVVQRQADGFGVMFDDLKLDEICPFLARAKTMQQTPVASAADVWRGLTARRRLSETTTGEPTCN